MGTKWKVDDSGIKKIEKGISLTGQEKDRIVISLMNSRAWYSTTSTTPVRNSDNELDFSVFNGVFDLPECSLAYRFHVQFYSTKATETASAKLRNMTDDVDIVTLQTSSTKTGNHMISNEISLDLTKRYSAYFWTSSAANQIFMCKAEVFLIRKRK